MTKTKTREGRPTKLTRATQVEIVRLLRAGNYVETAAHMVGLNPSTVHDWLARGARARGVTDQEFAEFAEAVRRAQAEAEARDVQRVNRAAGKTWRAAAWRLERRNPRHWSPRVQIAVAEEIDGFLSYLATALEPGLYEKVLAIAANCGSQLLPREPIQHTEDRE